MPSRPARPNETAYVAQTIAMAFASDPIWEVALRGTGGSTEHHEPYWRLFVEGAMRYRTVRISEGGGAVSVWLPPDGTELSDAQAADLERLVSRALAPAAVDALHALFRRFEANRAKQPKHQYLSLLATHPEHRGSGVGQRLLADDLNAWDAEGVPAYLESTNPGNDHRYERAGFQSIGGFRAVLDDAWINGI